MKEYRVSYAVRNAEQIVGTMPYGNEERPSEFVEAETNEEAIELIRQWALDNAERYAELDDNSDSVFFFEDDEKVEEYYDFRVEEN